MQELKPEQEGIKLQLGVLGCFCIFLKVVSKVLVFLDQSGLNGFISLFQAKRRLGEFRSEESKLPFVSDK